MNELCQMRNYISLNQSNKNWLAQIHMILSKKICLIVDSLCLVCIELGYDTNLS